MPAQSAHNIRLVLFDLGGVLVETTGVPAMLAWMDHRITAAELWTLWLRSPVVRRFETGRATPEEFAAQIVLDMRLPVSEQEFLQTFTSWITRLYPGALELVRSIPPRFTRATLCNTCALHWPLLMDTLGLEHAFDRHFASHLIGKIKPDAEAFEHVLDALNVKAAEAFFLDDNILNIEAARWLGIKAAHVNGPRQAEAALQDAGIL